MVYASLWRKNTFYTRKQETIWKGCDMNGWKFSSNIILVEDKGESR